VDYIKSGIKEKNAMPYCFCDALKSNKYLLFFCVLFQGSVRIHASVLELVLDISLLMLLVLLLLAVELVFELVSPELVPVLLSVLPNIFFPDPSTTFVFFFFPQSGGWHVQVIPYCRT